jgi:hypothetical protein
MYKFHRQKGLVTEFSGQPRVELPLAVTAGTEGGSRAPGSVVQAVLEDVSTKFLKPKLDQPGMLH